MFEILLSIHRYLENALIVNLQLQLYPKYRIIYFFIISGKNIGLLKEHKNFVQGVAWDPKGQFIATISSDR